MLIVQDLQVDRSGHRVLQGLSLTLGRGELVVLDGANGSGKSTALLAIAGRIPACGGTISWEGTRRTPVSVSTRLCGLLLQGGRVFRSMTVRENLEVAAIGLASSAAVSRRDDLCAELPLLRTLWNRSAGLLSGGERQVVALAMALVAEPPVLLLDEPFAGVDDANAQRMSELLERLRAERRAAMLVVEHRHVALSRAADRTLVLDEGRVCELAPAREQATNDNGCH